MLTLCASSSSNSITTTQHHGVELSLSKPDFGAPSSCLGGQSALRLSVCRFSPALAAYTPGFRPPGRDAVWQQQYAVECWYIAHLVSWHVVAVAIFIAISHAAASLSSLFPSVTRLVISQTMTQSMLSSCKAQTRHGHECKPYPVHDGRLSKVLVLCHEHLGPMCSCRANESSVKNMVAPGNLLSREMT